MKWRVFFKQEFILNEIALAILKRSPGLRNKLNHTHTKAGAKVEPSTSYINFKRPSVAKITKEFILFFLSFVFVVYHVVIVD